MSITVFARKKYFNESQSAAEGERHRQLYAAGRRHYKGSCPRPVDQHRRFRHQGAASVH
jgi:hypothetical protein